MLETITTDPLASEDHLRSAQTGFDLLLERLDPNRDQAGVRYENIRSRLLRFFESRRCDFPGDHADETIDRVIERIRGGAIVPHIESYCYGVAQLLLLEIGRERRKKQEAIQDLQLALQTSGGGGEQERLLSYLEQSMESLSVEERDLIIAYFQGEKREKIENRKKLAEQLGVPLHILRLRVHRIRAKLQERFFNCLKLRS